MATTGSLSQYAAHIDASPAYVTKLKKQGRLVLREVDGRSVVDFELSDRLVRNTTDMGRARNGANGVDRQREPSLPVQPFAERGRVDAIFRQAQAQERAYSAKLAELDYRERSGELVRRVVVERELAAKLVALRESLEVLADRLASVVAAESDAAACRRMIRDEHRGALAVFARELDAVPAGSSAEAVDGIA